MQTLLKGHEAELALVVGSALSMSNMDSIYESLGATMLGAHSWTLAIEMYRKMGSHRLPLIRCVSYAATAVIRPDEELPSVYNNAGFQEPQFYIKQAQQAPGDSQNQDPMEVLPTLILGQRWEEAAKKALPLLRGCFGKPQWDFTKAQRVANYLHCIPAGSLDEPLRMEVLAYCSAIGGQMAAWKAWHMIAYFMFNNARDLVLRYKISTPIPPDYFRFAALSELAYGDHRQCRQKLEELDRSDPTIRNNDPNYKLLDLLLGAENHRLDASDHVDNELCPTGKHLPTRSNLLKPARSVITGKEVQGNHYVLEDGRTAMSHAEALQWASVNPFSPLNTGSRMFPR
eukprot:NODE_2977_length_1303_cov_103.841525_g2828_i0.p1 GENE.NODE_2977_length_1303_cov_103.841525_g2828_i0~~NODE_2977_length_1303_cov_103.841525_g2828_i0.p1  ORF type:complete len:343 (+),score=46.52 NODE_2977_length_1303_cov_103.841525_g2828_i0:76-1104(+)